MWWNARIVSEDGRGLFDDHTFSFATGDIMVPGPTGISGTVMSLDESPLAGVQVTLEPGGTDVTTGSSGEFSGAVVRTNISSSGATQGSSRIPPSWLMCQMLRSRL